MEKEIYATTIGVFRMVKDLEKANLVQVQLLVSGFTGHENEIWENVGTMKKKAFFKMIKPHKPVKRTLKQAESSDSFWKDYSQV